MEEIWKPYPKDNNILVSNYGNVKTYYKYRSRDITNVLRDVESYDKCKGYRGVTIAAKCYRVHILVCETYHENPLNKPQVNHKDGIRWNNKANNLEWSTCSENIQHAFDTGLKKMTEETNLKISLKVSASKMGHTVSKEARKNISEGLKKYFLMKRLNRNLGDVS